MSITFCNAAQWEPMSVAAELRDQIGGDRVDLVGRRHAPALIHVGDHRLPIALLPLDHGHPLEVVAHRAPRLDEFLAGTARQRARGCGRRGRAEIGDEILNDGVGLARRQLRAAQHHVVDVLLPADGPVAARRDDAQGVALRAGGRDQLAPLAGRQGACGLRMQRRGGADNERRERAHEC